MRPSTNDLQYCK